MLKSFFLISFFPPGMCQASFSLRKWMSRLSLSTLSRMNPEFRFGFMLKTFSFSQWKEFLKLGEKKNPDSFFSMCETKKNIFRRKKRKLIIFQSFIIVFQENVFTCEKLQNSADFFFFHVSHIEYFYSCVFTGGKNIKEFKDYHSKT